MEKDVGFTVIELLIVIVIISIIAAIAVPNLMSANIRAKVSGVKADMGSIAIALEDYKIDDPGRDYPIEPPTPYGHDEIAVLGRAFDDPSDALGLGKLVYPLDASEPTYLKRIAGDPFNNDGVEDWKEDNTKHNHHYSYYTVDKDRNTSTSEAKYWALVSYGPDKNLDITNYSQAKAAVDSGTNLYDPDNGINSDGDIVIIGP